MQSGLLSHFFEVQRKQIIQKDDGSGDREQSWSIYFVIDGKLEGQSVRDFVASRKDQSLIAVRITVRFSDVEPNTNWAQCRLFEVDTGLYYRIVGVLPDNKTGREYVTLACEQGVYIWQDSP